MEKAVLLPVMVSLPNSCERNQRQQKEAGEHCLIASSCPERMAVQSDNAELSSSNC